MADTTQAVAPPYALNRFSTAETAQMTDIPNETLRTWRFRGLIPEHRHWNGSYDSLQVCALALRKVMVGQGQGPFETTRIGTQMAPAVLRAALRSRPGLVETRHDLGASPLKPAALSRLIAEAVAELKDLEEPLSAFDPDLDSSWLVSLDQEPYKPAADLQAVLNVGCADLRVIDLNVLGEQVSHRALKPLLFLRAM